MLSLPFHRHLQALFTESVAAFGLHWFPHRAFTYRAEKLRRDFTKKTELKTRHGESYKGQFLRECKCLKCYRERIRASLVKGAKYSLSSHEPLRRREDWERECYYPSGNLTGIILRYRTQDSGDFKCLWNG